MTSAASFRKILHEAGAVFDPHDGSPPLALDFGDWFAEHAAIVDGVALADYSDRTQIEVTGADRQSFLHNLCTNDVRGLVPGAGREAFVTSVQGKVLGHILIFCEPDQLVLETTGGQAQRLLRHFERYIIREEVIFADCSVDCAELLLAGPGAAGLLAGLAEVDPPTASLAHVEAEIAGCKVSLRRVGFVGPQGVLISTTRDNLAVIWRAIREAGAKPCGHSAVECARIEAGWPDYGRDINSDNLPQEVSRNATAVSFTKGCYLGQETVARIDALGHVNKSLVGICSSTNQRVALGSTLSAQGKEVGRVTSATFSPRLGKGLALAVVRRGHNAPGTLLESSAGPASVCPLPV